MSRRAELRPDAFGRVRVTVRMGAKGADALRALTRSDGYWRRGPGVGDVVEEALVAHARSRGVIPAAQAPSPSETSPPAEASMDLKASSGRQASRSRSKTPRSRSRRRRQ